MEGMGLLEFLVEAGGLSVVAILLIVVMVRQNQAKTELLKALHERTQAMNETLVARLTDTALPPDKKE